MYDIDHYLSRGVIEMLLQENRCLHCNKMLFKGRFITVQIKCPRCGTVNNLSASERHHGGTTHAQNIKETKPAHCHS
ncbi:TPA: Com family DNA-binding transcriptional regulator [Salmonella enterica subsp. enterica serovar Infantis]|nr:Com family DNA-binding transcriptional regulator [Salmonella enterica subsp. enterica serovar Infantis]HCJ0429093.1 Com family DNA-binding transcriptional regulator [Salmonella enterica subsp. enterica serovar Infantis]